ncbi:MAG: YqgE/AlgH family protein [Cytophagales bacterium]|nr:YqgE/AlgH family protein [Cytophagales bacterium]
MAGRQVQLEEKLKLESWIVSDQVSDALVFETNPELMWKEAMRRLGGRFSVYSNYPEDRRMNRMILVFLRFLRRGY